MNREEFKKLAEEEFINNTMKHLDSALIFTYIRNLEQKENNLQSKIDKANELIEENKDQVDWLHMPAWELENILKEDK